MPWRDKLRGFYAVLDRDDAALAQALLGAATVLQLRMKRAPWDERLAVCRWALPMCRAAGVLFVVNDDLELAREVGADAVHLGQDDLPVAEARRRAPSLIVGCSTHDLPQVEAAVAAGADYLGYGPVYATRTKANPDPVQGAAALAAACRAAAPVPVVGIGGITPERAPEVAAAGAAAACAIGAVNDAADPRAAAAAMAGAFAQAATRAL